jgi:hypothetical protein
VVRFALLVLAFLLGGVLPTPGAAAAGASTPASEHDAVARAPRAGIDRGRSKATRETPRQESPPALAAPTADSNHSLATAVHDGARTLATLTTHLLDTWTEATAQAAGRPTGESFHRPLRL